MRVANGVVLTPDVPDLDEDGRRAAEAASRGCEYCGGGGMVSVAPTSHCGAYRGCGATCVCLIGRWIREWHRVRCPEMHKKLISLEHVLDGRDGRWVFKLLED